MQDFPSSAGGIIFIKGIPSIGGIFTIGKAQPGTDNFTVLRKAPCFLFCFGKIQQTEDLIACRHAVHRNMKEAAKLPHRDEEIRREQDNQKTP